MDVTRKGYYTVEYGSVPLVKEDGTLLRVTSRDKCYSHILNDGRSGDFTIKCPDWEVHVEHPSGSTVGVPTGSVQLGVPRVSVPAGTLGFHNVDDDDGNYIS